MLRAERQEGEVLADTLRSALHNGVEELNGRPQPHEAGAKWAIKSGSERVIDNAMYYTEFEIGALPPGRGRILGNMLRRALLRQDLFRRHAVVALRVQRSSFKVDPFTRNVSFGVPDVALHEFASVPGVKESMIDVIRNVQQIPIELGPPGDSSPVEGTEPLRWRWATRRCGPCAIQASDLQIVDSFAHLDVPLRIADPHHHICRVTAPTAVDVEIQVAYSSQEEWDDEDNPEGKSRLIDLLNQNWLQVPPLFSPVRKVNYAVLASEDGKISEDGRPMERVGLEVWTRISERPEVTVQEAASKLLQALGEHQEPLRVSEETVDNLEGEEAAWEDLFANMPGQQATEMPEEDPMSALTSGRRPLLDE